MSQKLLKKLQMKKYREETGLFLVEGKKSILELLSSDLRVHTVYATLELLDEVEAAATAYCSRTGIKPEIVCLTEDKLVASGTFKSNNAGIAIARQRAELTTKEILEVAETSFVLVLDDVRDPGNVGTIIRTADWFGIQHIVTSPTTADFYNPKVVAGTMGSFTRVRMTELPLLPFLKEAQERNVPVIGALLHGEDLYSLERPTHGLIVMGSESHGIHEELLPFITNKVTIPRYGEAESLNVASATAVILAALRH